MQLDQFAAITRNVILSLEEGFAEFQPTVCFPERQEIRALSAVPLNEQHEPIALSWAANLARQGEEYLIAFRHSATEFKLVRMADGATEHQIYALT